MLHKNRLLNWFFSVTLIISISMMNVHSVLADEGTPTEPPAATEAPTQPPVEPTETPLPEAAPVSTEATPISEEQAPVSDEAVATTLLEDLPENTELVVLDENGNPVSLALQEAADIIVEADPMWCPQGVLPNGSGCTTNLTIPALLTLMQTNAGGTFSQHGVIYFERSNITTYTEPFILDDSLTSLGGSYNTLKTFNITLQGGWNGGGGTSVNSDSTFSGAGAYLQVGTSVNPWVGNVTVSDMQIGVSGAGGGVSTNNSLNVYTTSGNISLNNVDVRQQEGDFNTAYLQSTSGTITIGPSLILTGASAGSLFDGNNSGGKQNKGLSATTTGAISISGATFQDALRTGSAYGHGATLSAPAVTLTNVTAADNDGNGIFIQNANAVSLNNVTGGFFDPLLPTPPGPSHGNGLSGVYVNGTGSTIVNVSGGTFQDNIGYGVEVTGSTLYENSAPTCSLNTLATLANPCYNVTPALANTAPTLNLPGNIGPLQGNTLGGRLVTFSVTATDVEDNPDPTPTCLPASGALFPVGTTTVNCSVTDLGGLSASGSFTVTIADTTAPSLSLPAPITVAATSASGAVVTFSASATDVVVGAVSVTCVPPSGSTFPVGTTSVSCSATDGSNPANGSFNVTVQDNGAPTLTLPADITITATSSAGAIVNFTASATDVIDGSLPVTCVPPSGSTFPVGTTSVNCSATDGASNTTNGSFNVTVDPAPSSGGGGTGSGGTGQSNQSGGSPIAVTGGNLNNLACPTTNLQPFGIRITFTQLCGYQAAFDGLSASNLPVPLPNGASFVNGLTVNVLKNGSEIQSLPGGSSLQIEFPLPAGSDGNFVVMFLNNGSWTELAGEKTADGYYKITSTQTGVFILVKK